MSLKYNKLSMEKRYNDLINEGSLVNSMIDNYLSCGEEDTELYFGDVVSIIDVGGETCYYREPVLLSFTIEYMNKDVFVISEYESSNMFGNPYFICFDNDESDLDEINNELYESLKDYINDVYSPYYNSLTEYGEKIYSDEESIEYMSTKFLSDLSDIIFPILKSYFKKVYSVINRDVYIR